ncbi:MAG: hypothetical protein U1E27_01785, partial [Kiritimatiellia bacterium]|nr:hypothetical protein [Kiritimatiellia bacterium]
AEEPSAEAKERRKFSVPMFTTKGNDNALQAVMRLFAGEYGNYFTTVNITDRAIMIEPRVRDFRFKRPGWDEMDTDDPHKEDAEYQAKRSRLIARLEEIIVPEILWFEATPQEAIADLKKFAAQAGFEDLEIEMSAELQEWLELADLKKVPVQDNPWGMDAEWIRTDRSRFPGRTSLMRNVRLLDAMKEFVWMDEYTLSVSDRAVIFTRRSNPASANENEKAWHWEYPEFDVFYQKTQNYRTMAARQMPAMSYENLGFWEAYAKLLGTAAQAGLDLTLLPVEARRVDESRRITMRREAETAYAAFQAFADAFDLTLDIRHFCIEFRGDYVPPGRQRFPSPKDEQADDATP